MAPSEGCPNEQNDLLRSKGERVSLAPSVVSSVVVDREALLVVSGGWLRQELSPSKARVTLVKAIEKDSN